MARKPEGVEASVIHETVAVTYPRLNVPFYTAIVTYQTQDPVPRTIFIPLDEISPGKGEQVNAEISARKGSLYARYLEVRAKRILEDVQRQIAFRPETVRF